MTGFRTRRDGRVFATKDNSRDAGQPRLIETRTAVGTGFKNTGKFFVVRVNKKGTLDTLAENLTKKQVKDRFPTAKKL